MSTLSTTTPTSDPTPIHVRVDDGSAEWVEYQFPTDIDRAEITVVQYADAPARVAPYLDPRAHVDTVTARGAAQVLLAACDLADRLNGEDDR